MSKRYIAASVYKQQKFSSGVSPKLKQLAIDFGWGLLAGFVMFAPSLCVALGWVKG
ncbi:hypothetical protein [Collimonas pratensis]|uniref:Uncharacterized protein n=1 Tax=Collimonas pratensis TaxID=279113 RepID=A0ABM5Z762_9BURK|nr:hypothetical protein [Collimonas pratensis]AMP14878.1 hypothetical protein CPter291_2621 [Collimonas pratensis]